MFYKIKMITYHYFQRLKTKIKIVVMIYEIFLNFTISKNLFNIFFEIEKYK